MSTPSKVLRACLYGRYSTDKQSEASIDDQYRVCERLVEREALVVVARFEDRGISGGTASRPGYQKMLAAARRREFDIIVAEDLKRLWREQAEQWRCIKELVDLGIAVVTASGIDSRQPNFEIIASVYGAAAELDRKEAAYRTRRGLEGKATAGKSAGGRAFGYVPASQSGTGQIEVNELEAPIVRRIFEMYADGISPRAIAARLNAEGVPSPGANWKRKQEGPNAKRRRKWVSSAIHGDVNRGTGILNNERYIGRVIWGRSQWRRGAADSRKRTARIVEDKAQWVVRSDERLRVVSDELWDRVKHRQAVAASNHAHLNQRRQSKRGAVSKTLLSGLLECACCGSKFIAVDAFTYGCASYKNGGIAACSNTARIPRKRAEQLILTEIKDGMLSDEAVSLAQKAYKDEVMRGQVEAEPSVSGSPKLAKIESQMTDVRALVKVGTLSPSAANAALEALERERTSLTRAMVPKQDRNVADVIKLIPAAADEYRVAVDDITSTVLEPGEREQARALIFELLGEKRVNVSAEGKAVYADFELDLGVFASKAMSNENRHFQIGSGGRI